MFNNQEKKEKLKELYGEYPSEALRLAHEEHGKRIEEQLKTPPTRGHKINYGFNACLKMIREETDIDWEKVKWKEPTSSMVKWFSSAIEHERDEAWEWVEEQKLINQN